VGSISETDVTLEPPNSTVPAWSKWVWERVSSVFGAAPILITPEGARRTPFWLMVPA